MAGLLVQMLMREIRAVLARKEIRGRVEDKVNAKGETVIGVILDKRQPLLDGFGWKFPARARERRSDEVLEQHADQ